MDDSISRQAAITLPVLPKEYREYQTSNLDDAYEQGWNDLQKCIESLPSAQQWIPCSEMLPMDKGVYLVTDDSGRVAWVEKSWFMWCDDGSPFWEYANVTAWMPLPSPYREEDATT